MSLCFQISSSSVCELPCSCLSRCYRCFHSDQDTSFSPPPWNYHYSFTIFCVMILDVQSQNSISTLFYFASACSAKVPTSPSLFCRLLSSPSVDKKSNLCLCAQHNITLLYLCNSYCACCSVHRVVPHEFPCVSTLAWWSHEQRPSSLFCITYCWAKLLVLKILCSVHFPHLFSYTCPASSSQGRLLFLTYFHMGTIPQLSAFVCMDVRARLRRHISSSD